MDLIKLNIKNINLFSIISILVLLAGLAFWIYWGTRYNEWSDIGIYSITIFLVLAGAIGLIISLMDKERGED